MNRDDTQRQDSEAPEKKGGDKDPRHAAYADPSLERKPAKDAAKGDRESGNETDTEDAKPKKPAGPPWYRRPVPVGLLIVGLIAAAIAGVLLWQHSRDNVTTDDAYIDGIPQIVSPQVSGRVLRVCVDDNQDVVAGQLLLELDPADYQMRLDQANAAKAQAEAQLAEAEAQKTVYESQVEEARASLGTAEANATDAAHQLARYRRLKAVNAGAVSEQQMDSAVAAATSTAAQLNSAHKAVAAAAAQVGYADQQIEAAHAAVRSADSTVAQAALTLSYTRVLARISGRVANKTVTAGTVVAVGTPLLAVVPRDVYVTANLKETQLDHIQRGQPVKIHVDAYPEMKLTGKVDSIEPSSGQTFAALPAENATGNWVKVVQRVEVKIVFDRIPDDPNRRLAPGMSVEVDARVR